MTEIYTCITSERQTFSIQSTQTRSIYSTKVTTEETRRVSSAEREKSRQQLSLSSLIEMSLHSTIGNTSFLPKLEKYSPVFATVDGLKYAGFQVSHCFSFCLGRNVSDLSSFFRGADVSDLSSLFCSGVRNMLFFWWRY